MNRRLRFLAALLALAALSASYAEGVWASSTCASMDSMSADAMAARERSGSMDHDMGSVADHESSGPRPACPLLAVAGGCGLVSFPAVEPALGLGSAVPSGPMAAVAVSPELLLATSLLRPPRA